MRVLFASVVVPLSIMGCGESGGPAKAELPAPIVAIAAPVARKVTRFEYATGRVAPIDFVEIRARVSGYLKSIHFQPGSEVTKGQLLFEIDPEPYRAQLAKAKASQATAEADLASAEADLGRAQVRAATTKRDYERAENAFKRGAGSEADRDKTKGDFDEATANVRSAEAKIKMAKAQIEVAAANIRTADLDLGYCAIKAPISGVIGDRLVTEGNLVTGGQVSTTKLTTIVAVEKMDVGFDVDERTLQEIQQSIRDGKIKVLKVGEIPVEGGLALHGADYPLKGSVNFADNQVDQKTGTIHMKARFDNSKPANGPRLMAAGMYTRIRVPIGEAVPSMLVPDSALSSDQGLRFLYLVGPDNKAVRMDATLGDLDGELRVIEAVQNPEEGKPRSLTTDDRVIVNGLVRVRPGLTVDPRSKK